MSEWDKLFQEKIKEVLHYKHRDYEYASLSPTACGNVARALIAEEYRAQQGKIDSLQENNARLDAELDTANKAYMWMDETYKGNLAQLEALKDQLDGCTCQGGHSEAWLRAKGRLK